MNIHRRQFIKGFSAGGITPLLIPFLNQLNAQNNGVTPKRFLFVVKSSGLTPSELVPPDLVNRLVKSGDSDISPDELIPSKSLIDLPLNDYSLPESLSPLQPHSNYLTILQGLSLIHI